MKFFKLRFYSEARFYYDYSAHSRGFSVTDYMNYYIRLFILPTKLGLFIFTTIVILYVSNYMFILTRPVNFPVEGNRSARRKPTTFGRALTDSSHDYTRVHSETGTHISEV
jgi:hypothetical protein